MSVGGGARLPVSSAPDKSTADRKSSGGRQAAGAPLAIVLGIVLDGIPETAALRPVVLAFAGGAVLTMLADTMMPEAFEHSGRATRLATTLGFALAFAISSLE
jgi:zinc transporter ZupT